eukprot:Opistho-1_new@8915
MSVPNCSYRGRASDGRDTRTSRPTALTPPTTTGAMVTMRRSTKRLVRKLCITDAPPSTISDAVPRETSSRNTASMLSIEPSSFRGTGTTVAPAASSTTRRSTAAFGPQKIHGRVGPESNLAVRGKRRCVSSTTGCGFVPCTRRTVNRGSSVRMVPMPTIMAVCVARSPCVSVIDFGPLSMSGRLSAVAMHPSRLCAYVRVTYGRSASPIPGNSTDGWGTSTWCDTCDTEPFVCAACAAYANSTSPSSLPFRLSTPARLFAGVAMSGVAEPDDAPLAVERSAMAGERRGERGSMSDEALAPSEDIGDTVPGAPTHVLCVD